MRRIHADYRSVLAATLAASVAACSSSPVAPPPLDGTWEWQANGNPSGSGIVLVLSQSPLGNSITGTGNVCGVGPSCDPGPVAITGQLADSSFTLTITGTGGYMATYVGVLQGDNELSGTWTVGTSSGPDTFYRKQT